jgi:hypothetical protein
LRETERDLQHDHTKRDKTQLVWFNRIPIFFLLSHFGCKNNMAIFIYDPIRAAKATQFLFLASVTELKQNGAYSVMN